MSANTENPASTIGDSLKMGELAIQKGNGVLRTLLGSCVGLALYCKSRPIGGLAHIVLPDSLGRAKPAGKFADTAVPELVRQITVHGGSRHSLVAKIAGGANMLKQANPDTIGERVLASLRNCLEEYKIPILGEHCGGNHGRRMLFWPHNGKVRIELVGGECYEF